MRTSVTPSNESAKVAVGVEPTLTTGQAWPRARNAVAPATTASRSRAATARIASVLSQLYEPPACVITPSSESPSTSATSKRRASPGAMPARWPSLSISTIVGMRTFALWLASTSARAASTLSTMVLTRAPRRSSAATRGTFAGTMPTA